MILLDTCVVSEALRPEPSAKVLEWLAELPEHQVFIPSVVIGELWKGVDLLPDGDKRSALRLWLEQLRERFRGRILGFDEDAAVAWGTLTARMERMGRRLHVVDGMLAALALRNSALLATRNMEDFSGTGISGVDPWGSGAAETDPS